MDLVKPVAAVSPAPAAINGGTPLSLKLIVNGVEL